MILGWFIPQKKRFLKEKQNQPRSGYKGSQGSQLRTLNVEKENQNNSMYIFQQQNISENLLIVLEIILIPGIWDIDIERSGYRFREIRKFANRQNFPRSAPAAHFFHTVNSLYLDY